MALALGANGMANLIKSIGDSVQNVKVYRRRCENLILRCEILIGALREDEVEASRSVAHDNAVNEAKAVLEIVRHKVTQWAQLNTVRSLVNQDSIREGIDELHKQVDTCISACQVRMSQQMAQVQNDHIIESQRDMIEIRGMVQDLLVAFEWYLRTWSTVWDSDTFQAVVQDIEEETRDIPSPAPAIPEGTSGSQSFISSQSDAFDHAMKKFCKSLVKLELSLPTDVEARENSPYGYSHWQLPMRSLSQRTRTSLVGRWRSSTVSLGHHIPPLDFGEDTFWENGTFASMEPSSPALERSVDSRRNSSISGVNTFTYPSQRSVVQRVERRLSEQSSILNVLNAFQPLTPLNVALTTCLSVWKSAGQPRVITRATMEGLIHYLLSSEDDKEQHDIFFIAHLAFIAPLNVLGMLIRWYDEALKCPEEACHYIQTHVIRLIKDWLNNEHVIVGEEVLTEMRKFIATINKSGYVGEPVLEILQGIRKKAAINVPPSPITSSSGPTTGSRPTPRQLAIALTRLAGEKYRLIFPIEFMAHASELPLYCPNLSAAITLNERIYNWVQSCILVETLGEDLVREGLKRRLEMKKIFVETAKECQKMSNFSSLGAILSALQSEAITRLTLTQRSMTRSVRSTYKDLVKLVKPDYNYCVYKNALFKCQLEGCIPWHVVNLHDVQTTVQQEKDVDDQHDPPLILLEKWATLKRHAISALWYPLPPTNEGNSHGVFDREASIH